MNAELFKKYVKKIVQEEINSSLKELISESIKSELKKLLLEKNQKSSVKQVSKPIQQEFTENQNLNKSLREIIGDFDTTELESETINNEEYTREKSTQTQHPLLSKPLTGNPAINQILTEMVVNGYEHVKSETSMSPLGSFAMNPQITPASRSSDSGAPYIGAAGPGFIQDPNEEVWDIRKGPIINKQSKTESQFIQQSPEINIPQNAPPQVVKNIQAAQTAITRDYRDLMKMFAKK